MHNYTEPPSIRALRSFDFPSLVVITSACCAYMSQLTSFQNRRGVFVIEFVGNGQSSRTVVQKGYLNVTQRVGVAGQAFTVWDEHNNVVDDATVSLSYIFLHCIDAVRYGWTDISMRRTKTKKY